MNKLISIILMVAALSLISTSFTAAISHVAVVVAIGLMIVSMVVFNMKN
jgi:hypothetical protein